jgi:hypothetical protein
MQGWKKCAVVTIVALMAAGPAMAQRKGAKRTNTYNTYERSAPAASTGHRMAGCGLGSLAIESNDKWSQVGAAFLNATGMQTFGITFGTSNCTEDGVTSAAREKDAFIEANFADLRRDLSVGSGEYLSGLASLYGCEGASADAFGVGLQKHQAKVLGSSPETAPRAIDEVVSAEGLSCQG